MLKQMHGVSDVRIFMVKRMTCRSVLSLQQALFWTENLVSSLASWPTAEATGLTATAPPCNTPAALHPPVFALLATFDARVFALLATAAPTNFSQRLNVSVGASLSSAISLSASIKQDSGQAEMLGSAPAVGVWEPSASSVGRVSSLASCPALLRRSFSTVRTEMLPSILSTSDGSCKSVRTEPTSSATYRTRLDWRRRCA
eukprot:772173-Prymnesium_polylepis.1